ncbi:hypothetical protein [Acetobacterium woodii]|uniref:hypothetical protein n=1 Tax=Acetobacterium woodii TaxID=33952 RepID=UPI0003097BC3|nr:hypothetical protein [Acetobacterium woodii]
MEKFSIITSGNAYDFNQQLSDAFKRGAKLIGGIKSIPKGDESCSDCEYDYITFVSYDQAS